MGKVEPRTLLARAQGAWAEVAGPGLAPRAEPVSERGGVLTVACESAVWAQELELLAPDLLIRINEVLKADHGPGVERIRCVVRSGVN